MDKLGSGDSHERYNPNLFLLCMQLGEVNGSRQPDVCYRLPKFVCMIVDASSNHGRIDVDVWTRYTR